MATVAASSSTATTRRVRAAAGPAHWVWWLHDDFAGATFDQGTWLRYTIGKGVDVAQQDGRLTFTVDPEATSDDGTVEARVVTTCVFQSDFDAHVDYELLGWPDGSGVVVGLAASIGGGSEFAFYGIDRDARGAVSDQESYVSSVRATDSATETGDVSGSLRLARKDGVLSTYFLSSKGWVRGASAYEPRAISLTLHVRAPADTSARMTSSAAFDNFDATSDSAAYSIFCPDKWPPRKNLGSH